MRCISLTCCTYPVIRYIGISPGILLYLYRYVASRYKVARPLTTKQAKDTGNMIADIYKVGPLTYPKIFQCGNGSQFKGETTRLLEKHEVTIWHITTKYKYTHLAFVEALNKLLEEQATQGSGCARTEWS